MADGVPLLAVNKAKVEEIALNKRLDQFWATLRDLAERVVAGHWDVYVDATAWNEFLAGERERFDAHSLMSPVLYDDFASVTVMSACFEETMMALLWREHFALKFPVHQQLMKDLRYSQHPNGERMEILWAADEAWSKRYRNAEVSFDGEMASILDVVSARAVAAMPEGAPFLWQANKDIADDHFDDIAEGRSAIRLPFVTHGLNKYQYIHNVVVLSALNPPPSHFAFLAQFGLSSEQVRTALYRQAVYQTAGRSSIRNLECKEKVRAVVMDRDTASWAATQFPGCTTEALPGADLMPAKKRPGRPRKHENDAERKAKERQADVEARILETQRLETHLAVLGGELRIDDMVNEEFRERIRADLGAAAISGLAIADLAGTAYADKYSRLPLDHVRHGTPDEFAAFLREAWDREVANKDEAGLLSPALFDPAATDETARGYGNIVAIRGIWLDVDDGSEMSADEFAAIFANWRMVIVNSYSSTVAKPRYRIIIPTTCVMSRDVHQAIVAEIIGRLRRCGYYGDKDVAKRHKKGLNAKRHGLDLGKTVPTSLFYLPSHPADPAAAFFRDYAGSGRKALDPLNIIQRRAERDRAKTDYTPSPVAVLPAAERAFNGSEGMKKLQAALLEKQSRSAHVQRQQQVSDSIANWRASAMLPGVGNAAFFQLAMGLARSGLTPHEIERTLREEAAYAQHPAERRAEIKRLMNSVKKAPKKAA